MNRDEARQIIIVNFADAEAVAVIEKAIASIEATARVKGLRVARAICAFCPDEILEAIDAEIAALERGKE